MTFVGRPKFTHCRSVTEPVFGSCDQQTRWIMLALFGCSLGLGPLTLTAQTVPIAVVSTDNVKLTGSIEIPDGKAAIEKNGSIAAGNHPAQVTLPHRGLLKICPTTKINLSTDSLVVANMPDTESPGLLMALDHGAFEAYFGTRQNSDVVLTPDFRIVISGPGLAAVQVRLGAAGDLCVGNGGENAPYVTVSSIFNGGVYRVNANQRVTFQHGNLNAVVDREKESCGCPPDTPLTAGANEFPLAQSAGMAPVSSPPPNAVDKGTVNAQASAQLGYEGSKSGSKPGSEPDSQSGSGRAGAAGQPALALPPSSSLKPPAKPGFFRSIGRFFRKVFGG